MQRSTKYENARKRYLNRFECIENAFIQGSVDFYLDSKDLKGNQMWSWCVTLWVVSLCIYIREVVGEYYDPGRIQN